MVELDRIICGDCLEVLKTLPAESVDCCITSPPYYGLRSYLPDGHPDKKLEIGLDATPEAYVARLVEVFREVRRVLKPEGTLWLNLGDSFASGKGTCFNPGGGSSSLGKNRKEAGAHPLDRGNISDLKASGLKPKDLIGIPWTVAFALRADGWYLRQDIIWSKGNPMPESVKDRCVKSHEYLFILSKSPRYYFDYIAIQEDSVNGKQKVQQMRKDPSGGHVHKEQSKERRPVPIVQNVSFSDSEEMGSQIQPVRQGEGDRSSILLFREGAGNQNRISESVCLNGRTEGKISRSGKEARKRREVQSSPEEIRSITERQSDESSERREIYQNSKGQILQTQDRDKTQTSDQNFRLYDHKGGMGRDQESVQPSVRLLRARDAEIGNGSCHSIIEGREPYSDEHSSCLPEVQCQQGGSEYAFKRNRRSVWHINTKPYKGAHFATFPEKLIEPCILAGTSERGYCPACGKPWVRQVEHPYKGDGNPYSYEDRAMAGNKMKMSGKQLAEWNTDHPSKFIGWHPSCQCASKPRPGIVLDPFSGAGTVALVAKKLGRHYIGIDLNPDYISMAKARVQKTPVNLRSFEEDARQ